MTPDSRLARFRKNKGLLTAVKIAFAVAVLTFGVIYVAQRWTQIQGPLGRAKVGWLLLALACALGGLGLAMYSTMTSLAVTSGRRLSVIAACRVFFVSQLGKYIPGSVWPVVAVTALTRKYGISASQSAAGGLLALFLSLVAGGSFGIVLTLVASPGAGGAIWWLLLLIPVAVVLARPTVTFGVLNFALRIVRRSPLTPDHRAGDYAWAVAASVASWMFTGLQCWALCVALGADPGRSFFGAVGGFALAYTAGTLFVPAPAGVGVREAVLTFALGGTLQENSAFSSASVLAVVLLSRVLLALLDFGLAGITLVLYRLFAGQEPVARSSGPGPIG